VILTPHVAAASVRIAGRHQETLLKNVQRFVRGEELETWWTRRIGSDGLQEDRCPEA
jgi:phosphoglycerate dehydrogenase-like enzyme